MTNKKIVRKKKVCIYCKYEWKPIKKNPVACPKCKRYFK